MNYLLYLIDEGGSGGGSNTDIWDSGITPYFYLLLIFIGLLIIFLIILFIKYLIDITTD